jgi:hypothetical protein
VNPPEATAGLCPGYLAVATLLKRIISGLFLPGPLLHSGMLYLTIVFKLPWAGQVLATGIGPVMLLAAIDRHCRRHRISRASRLPPDSHMAVI